MSEVIKTEELFYTNITRFNLLDTPQKCEYSLNYPKPLIQNVQKFNVAVERLYLSTNTIPIADLTGRSLLFSIKRLSDGVTETRDIMTYYSSSSSTGDKILRSYADLVKAFNMAIMMALQALGYASANIEVQFRYDPTLKNIVCLYSYSYPPNRVDRQYDLIMSVDVYNLFGIGFPCIENPVNNTFTFNAFLEPLSYTLEPFSQGGTLKNFYKILPESNNMGNWHDADRIVLKTNLPVFNEVVSTAQFGGIETNAPSSILTDFHFEPSQDRESVLYNSGGNPRIINMIGSDTLNAFYISVYYSTKAGELKPVYITKYCNFDIKLRFSRNSN